MNSLPGDLYLTRNIPELNLTRGYWQHVALTSGRLVIEGQAEPGQVIMVFEESFLRRNPERLHLRPKDSAIGLKALGAMEGFVGEPYHRFLANCTTYVKRAYAAALGYKPKWVWPDDIAKSQLFLVLEHYQDYENWSQPEDWYEGRVA